MSYTGSAPCIGLQLVPVALEVVPTKLYHHPHHRLPLFPTAEKKDNGYTSSPIFIWPKTKMSCMSLGAKGMGAADGPSFHQRLWFPSQHLQLVPLATRQFGVGAEPNNLMESSWMRGRMEKNPIAPPRASSPGHGPSW